MTDTTTPDQQPAPQVDTATTEAFNQAVRAIKDEKKNASGYIQEYLKALSVTMEIFRIKEQEENFGDAIMESIRCFIPYRAQFIELLLIIANYGQADNYGKLLHRFFENLIPYSYLPKKYEGTYRRIDFDNFKFITHELFLYTIAIFLKTERFEIVHYLISENYYAESNIERGGNQAVSYLEFCHYVESINQIRKRQLGLDHGTPQANFINERTRDTGIDFQYLMQADFILFIRNELIPTDAERLWWHPITLFSSGRSEGAFEIFVRAESIRYFDNIKPLIGIEKKDDMSAFFNMCNDPKGKLASTQLKSPFLKFLMNFDKLATKA